MDHRRPLQRDGTRAAVGGEDIRRHPLRRPGLYRRECAQPCGLHQRWHVVCIWRLERRQRTLKRDRCSAAGCAGEHGWPPRMHGERRRRGAVLGVECRWPAGQWHDHYLQCACAGHGSGQRRDRGGSQPYRQDECGYAVLLRAAGKWHGEMLGRWQQGPTGAGRHNGQHDPCAGGDLCWCSAGQRDTDCGRHQPLLCNFCWKSFLLGPQ